MHSLWAHNSQNMSWLERPRHYKVALSALFMLFSLSAAHALPSDKPDLEPLKPLIQDDIIGNKDKRHKADTVAGAKSAQKLCANCHIFKGYTPEQTGAVGIPSFSNIANKKDQTIDKLTRFLFVPHGSMPDMHLTTNEIADITAFIMSHQAKPTPKTKDRDPNRKYPVELPKKS